jgi:hypothetical protein
MEILKQNYDLDKVFQKLISGAIIFFIPAIILISVYSLTGFAFTFGALTLFYILYINALKYIDRKKIHHKIRSPIKNQNTLQCKEEVDCLFVFAFMFACTIFFVISMYELVLLFL